MPATLSRGSLDFQQTLKTAFLLKMPDGAVPTAIHQAFSAVRLARQERLSSDGYVRIEGLVHASGPRRSAHFGETAPVCQETTAIEGHPLASIGSGFVREPGQFFPPFVHWLR